MRIQVQDIPGEVVSALHIEFMPGTPTYLFFAACSTYCHFSTQVCKLNRLMQKRKLRQKNPSYLVSFNFTTFRPFNLCSYCFFDKISSCDVQGAKTTFPISNKPRGLPLINKLLHFRGLHSEILSSVIKHQL
jgi:hypothetical protein